MIVVGLCMAEHTQKQAGCSFRHIFEDYLPPPVMNETIQWRLLLVAMDCFLCFCHASFSLLQESDFISSIVLEQKPKTKRQSISLKKPIDDLSFLAKHSPATSFIQRRLIGLADLCCLQAIQGHVDATCISSSAPALCATFLEELGRLKIPVARGWSLRGSALDRLGSTMQATAGWICRYMLLKACTPLLLAPS